MNKNSSLGTDLKNRTTDNRIGRNGKFNTAKFNTAKFNTAKFNTRLIAGAILIAASFISAYLISHSNNRMITVWSATSDLAPGQIIAESDVAPTQVSMPRNAFQYLSTEYPITGSQVLRTIGSSELIPAYSLSKELHLDLKKIPISLSRTRIAMGVRSGSLIDIYTIPRIQFNGTSEIANIPRSRMLLTSVSVDAVDQEASKLGGDVAITVLVPSSQVTSVISAMSDYDFVVVQSN